MKNIISLTFVLAVGILSVMGCSQSGVVQLQDIPAPQSTPIVFGENIAAWGTASASVIGHSANEAIDGNPSTMWNSHSLCAALVFSFLCSFLFSKQDRVGCLNKIELVVSQHEPGPTTHEIWLSDDSGTTTLYKKLNDVYTEEGQVLEIVIDPPQNINQVYVLTRRSQGWVAWYEVRVFAQGLPTKWQLTPLVSGLEFPVQVIDANDGSGRLFVGERKGRIQIVKSSVINDTPFLDISDRVLCCTGVEDGFYKIAFPPSYPDRKHFYVSYLNLDGDTVFSRYTTTDDPDRADPDSEEILLTIDQPRIYHNGGSIAFGPKDGYLYISSGDGGENKYQGVDTLLGKILRIDVESGDKPYGIPASNPFAQVDGYRGEIWSLGLRNPWGIAFDQETGDFFIPDVGDGRREEVNYQPASSAGGENYGWGVWEGNFCRDLPELPCAVDGLEFPVSVFDHTQGCAVVGGAVYQGVFFYGDFCRGGIWALSRRGDGWQNKRLVDASVPLSSIDVDDYGNIYASGVYGVIYILEPPE